MVMTVVNFIFKLEISPNGVNSKEAKGGSARGFYSWPEIYAFGNKLEGTSIEATRGTRCVGVNYSLETRKLSLLVSDNLQPTFLCAAISGDLLDLQLKVCILSTRRIH